MILSKTKSEQTEKTILDHQKGEIVEMVELGKEDSETKEDLDLTEDIIWYFI